MIRGLVTERFEPVIALWIRGPSGQMLDVDAVIDTGFTGMMTMPIETVEALGLVREYSGRAVMADGMRRKFDVHATEVGWGDEWRPVFVSAIGEEVLIGMKLLAGCELRVVVAPGGEVEITLSDQSTPGFER